MRTFRPSEQLAPAVEYLKFGGVTHKHASGAHRTLLQMAREAGLSRREMAGLGVALGMSATGIGMVVLAFLDPEPTSKLGLLVGGGVMCYLYGGLGALRILTNLRPPSVRVTTHGIEIDWT